MKKMLLTLGTAAAVLAPVATIVACGGKTGSGDGSGDGSGGGTTGGGKTTGGGVAGALPLAGERVEGTHAGLHVLIKPYEQKKELAKKDRTEDVTSKHTTLDVAALKLAQDIRKDMNAETDAVWHTYGDPILDGINAVRLALHNSANGDNKLRDKIKDFTDAGLPTYRKAQPKDSNFQKLAKKHVNDWFDKGTGLFIVSAIPGWAAITKGGTVAKDDRYKNFAGLKGDNVQKVTKTYGALTLGTPELLTAQHRVQEVDWRGDFDDHDHGSTMKLIKDKATTSNKHATGEFADAPTGDQGFKGENYMFAYTYNSKKFEDGADFTSGLLSAINVLYDSDDASATTGHRTNYYSPTNTTFGWARHAASYGAANWNNFQYILTESGGEKMRGATATPAELKAHPGAQLLMDNPASTEDIARIKKANPFLTEYSMDILKYIPPMAFVNAINVNKEFVTNNYNAYLADQKGKEVVEELYKPHKDIKELETALEKPFTSVGFADWIDLKQPTAYYEWARFAKPQETGKPDTLVKSYDYNGGGTITGHQYGYTDIDKSLFE